MQSRQLHILAWLDLKLTHTSVIKIALARPHPFAQQVVMHFRVDIAERSKQVAAWGAVGGAHDLVVLVDPN